MKFKRLLGIVVSSLIFATTYARAEVITFTFTGSLSMGVCGNSLCDPSQMLDSSIRVGTPIFGYYSFDTLMQGTIFPSVGGGGMLSESVMYSGQNGAFSLTAGNYTFSSLPNSLIAISVADDFYGATNTVSSDQYRILTRVEVSSTTQILPGLVDINTMELSFARLGTLGQSVAPLSTALMPTDPAIINAFGGGSLVVGLNFASPLAGDTRLILGMSVPGVQLAAVPEPSTHILFLVGALGLLAFHRKTGVI